jgi:hypothetical protein
LIILSVVGLVCGGQHVYAGAFGVFRIGDWTGNAYRNDRTREFEYCTAQSTSADGITIIYSLDRRYVWSFELSSPNWNFARGASFRIAFRLNKRESVGQRAYAITNKLIRVDFADSLGAFTELSRVLQMEVIAGGLALHFNLSYGPDVLVGLTRCVTRNEPLPRLKDMSPVLRASGSSTIVDGGSDAVALATTIIKLSTVKGAKLVRVEEVPSNLKANVFWKIDPVLFSASLLAPGQAPELNNLPSFVVSRDSQLCRGGEFFAAATFQRSNLLKGSDAPLVARTYTFCQIPGTRTTVYYVATPRKKGGLYLLATIGRGSEFSPAIEQAAKDFDDDVLSVLKAALK